MADTQFGWKLSTQYQAHVNSHAYRAPIYGGKHDKVYIFWKLKTSGWIWDAFSLNQSISCPIGGATSSTTLSQPQSKRALKEHRVCYFQSGPMALKKLSRPKGMHFWGAISIDFLILRRNQCVIPAFFDLYASGARKPVFQGISLMTFTSRGKEVSKPEVHHKNTTNNTFSGWMMLNWSI